MGGDEEFTREGGFHRAAAQGFFSGDARDIGVVVFLGDVRKDEVARVGIETIGISKEFAYRVIGEMASAGEDALLDNPWVRTDFKHIEVVIGFENHAIGFAKVNFNELRHVTEVGADGYFDSVGAEGEGDGIGRVMRNGKGVDVDIADGKTLASVNGFDAAKTFGESFGQRTVERAHGRLGDVQGRLPDAENLRKPVAMIGMFVSDQYSVEGLDVAANCGQAREGFTFAKASVDEDASIFSFKEG